jgi:hypothetical protein
MSVRLASIPVALGVLAIAGSALAQASAENEARALVLFKEAVAALDKGDYAEACPKFEAAMKLYPSPSTELNIARCFERDGKTASAWAAYQRVLVLNRDTTQPRRREALEKMANDGAAALQGRVPALRIVVPAAPPGLRVAQDGQELPAASYGVELPVDPGAHEIVATAPGYETSKQVVTAIEGKRSEVTIVLTATPPPPVAPVPPLLPRDVPPVVEEHRPGVPAWAWVVGGAGVALVAGAAVFRVDWAKMDTKQQMAGCGADLMSCPASYTTLEGDNARKDRDRALFVGLGAAGVVGLGAGLIGIVTGSVARRRAPRPAPVGASLRLGRDGAGIALEGAY